MVYIMCYTDDATNQTGFERFNPKYGEPFLAAEEWKADNPGRTLSYMFPYTSDKSDQHVKYETFREKAPKYGLLPTDYGKMFAWNLDICRITGIRTERKKYKIEITNVGTGRVSLCTPGFAKTMLEKHPIRNVGETEI